MHQNKELHGPSSALTSLCRAHSHLQRIRMPSHCGILGNETMDTVAKEGATKEQEDSSTLFTEAKTMLNNLHRGQDHAQQPSQRPRPSSTPFKEAKTKLNSLHRGQDQAQLPSQRPRPTTFTEAKTKSWTAQQLSQRPRPSSTPFIEAKAMLNNLHRGQDQEPSQRPRPRPFTEAKTKNLHRGQDQEP